MIDTIFHNGRVWTGREQSAPASALAVENGRISAVGADADVLALSRAGTRVIDLGGRALLPGFIDAHAHIWKIGHLLTTMLDVRGVESLAALSVKVREHSQRLAPGAWLLGRGYNEARFAEGRQPTRQDLDAAVADRPVVLTRTCGHIIACNSLALRLCGVGAETPVPAGGVIDRGENGAPNGILRETAMGLVTQKMPAPTRDDYAAMITSALWHQLSLGITSTNDAGVAPEILDTYRWLDREERLPSRVNVMALRLVDGRGAVPLPERHVTDQLRVDSVKFFADGGLSGATAALSVPYRHADTRGVLRLDADEFLSLAREAHLAGWRIATHAIGDVAIDLVLDVYELLGRGPVRHRIEHFGLPDGRQLARAARLGVVAVPQTVFIHALGRNFRQYLPDSLLPRAYPIRAMLEAGLTVALSSDAPVVEDDSPLLGIQSAILRKDAEGHLIAPGEAITTGEALDAYAHGGAIASGDEDNRGRLRAGLWADLAVLSRDPFTAPPEELTTIRVEQTWVGGQLRYQAP